MRLHLFSSPGRDIRAIIEACRPHLEGKSDPTVAYLPLGSLYAERWIEDNGRAFKDLARLEIVNTELMDQQEIEDILRRCSLVYVPGGNTFLLTHRLHLSGIMPYLQRKVQSGLPLVGFGAGATLCGPNILTTTDMNTVETSHFDGLKVSPFNLYTPYPLDAYGQSVQDRWLADYHFFHDNPVIMLCDDAHVKRDGKKTVLVGGRAWILRKDQDKEELKAGKPILS